MTVKIFLDIKLLVLAMNMKIQQKVHWLNHEI